MSIDPPQAEARISAVTHFEKPNGPHGSILLSDGTRVMIRQLREEDRDREKDLIRQLSPDSRRFRFMGAFREASPALINQLMDVDYTRRTAFLALAHGKATSREVGVSR
jgi:hypothetical protein